MPQTNAPPVPAVSLERVTVAFGAGAARYVAVADADLAVGTSEFVAIVGPTGCAVMTAEFLAFSKYVEIGRASCRERV